MYLMSKNKDHRNYIDGKYSGAYIDEFNTGHLTYDFINEFTQGDPMQLNYKGSSVMKKDHFPVYFLSNLFPWEVYRKQGRVIDTILNRMKIIYTYRIPTKTNEFTYHAKIIWDPSNNNTNYPNMNTDVYQFAEYFKKHGYEIPTWLYPNIEVSPSPASDTLPSKACDVKSNIIQSSIKLELSPSPASATLPGRGLQDTIQPETSKNITNTWQGLLPTDIVLNNNKYIVHKLKIRRKHRYRDENEKIHLLEVSNLIINRTNRTFQYVCSHGEFFIEKDINFYTLKTDLQKSGINISEYIVYMYNNYNVNINEFT
jgi:hypothetical protein